MELNEAIQKVTAEYNVHNVPEGQSGDPGEVAWEIRGALTTAELGSWHGKVAPALIEAYRVVLDASEDTVSVSLAVR